MGAAESAWLGAGTIDRPDGRPVECHCALELLVIHTFIDDESDTAAPTWTKPERVGHRFRSIWADEMRAAAFLWCGGGVSIGANTARDGYCAVGIVRGPASTGYRIAR